MTSTVKEHHLQILRGLQTYLSVADFLPCSKKLEDVSKLVKIVLDTKSKDDLGKLKKVVATTEKDIKKEFKNLCEKVKKQDTSFVEEVTGLKEYIDHLNKAHEGFDLVNSEALDEIREKTFFLVASIVSILEKIISQTNSEDFVLKCKKMKEEISKGNKFLATSNAVTLVYGLISKTYKTSSDLITKTLKNVNNVLSASFFMSFQDIQCLRLILSSACIREMKKPTYDLEKIDQQILCVLNFVSRVVMLLRENTSVMVWFVDRHKYRDVSLYACEEPLKEIGVNYVACLHKLLRCIPDENSVSVLSRVPQMVEETLGFETRKIELVRDNLVEPVYLEFRRTLCTHFILSIVSYKNHLFEFKEITKVNIVTEEGVEDVYKKVIRSVEERCFDEWLSCFKKYNLEYFKNATTKKKLVPLVKFMSETEKALYSANQKFKNVLVDNWFMEDLVNAHLVLWPMMSVVFDHLGRLVINMSTRDANMDILEVLYGLKSSVQQNCSFAWLVERLTCLLYEEVFDGRRDPVYKKTEEMLLDYCVTGNVVPVDLDMELENMVKYIDQNVTPGCSPVPLSRERRSHTSPVVCMENVFDDNNKENLENMKAEYQYYRLVAGVNNRVAPGEDASVFISTKVKVDYLLSFMDNAVNMYLCKEKSPVLLKKKENVVRYRVMEVTWFAPSMASVMRLWNQTALELISDSKLEPSVLGSMRILYFF